MGISNDDTDVSDESHPGDSHADIMDDSQLIRLKSCPRCKTPIRKSLRYGNVIKQQLNDIEKVKEKLLGKKSELEGKKERLSDRHFNMRSMLEEPDWQKLKRSILKLNSEWMAAVLENKLTLLERFCDTRKKMKSILGKVSREVLSENNLQGKFEFYSMNVLFAGEFGPLPPDKYSDRGFLPPLLTDSPFRDSGYDPMTQANLSVANRNNNQIERKRLICKHFDQRRTGEERVGVQFFSREQWVTKNFGLLSLTNNFGTNIQFKGTSNNFRLLLNSFCGLSDHEYLSAVRNVTSFV